MSAAEQLAFSLAVAGFATTDPAWANVLLARWGHYLGACERPFGAQAWMLDVAGRPVAVAVSASTVSEHVAGVLAGAPARFDRGEVVELARLCSHPDHRWATRPALRLWREVAAPRWPYWPVRAAVAYSQNSRHQGDLYRWDGWQRISTSCGSSGGGAWSRKRYATDVVHGRKSLWLWEYDAGEAP